MPFSLETRTFFGPTSNGLSSFESPCAKSSLPRDHSPQGRPSIAVSLSRIALLPIASGQPSALKMAYRSASRVSRAPVSSPVARSHVQATALEHEKAVENARITNHIQAGIGSASRAVDGPLVEYGLSAPEESLPFARQFVLKGQNRLDEGRER